MTGTTYAQDVLAAAIAVYEHNRQCRLSNTVKRMLADALNNPAAASEFLATGRIAVPVLTMQFNLRESPVETPDTTEC